LHVLSLWIDPDSGVLATDASSQARLDEVVSALVRAFPSLQLSLLNTQITPQTAMTGWLSTTDTDEWPAGFAVERECELKSHDEEKSVVRYTRHHLLNDEVRLHLQQGKRPTRLAMVRACPAQAPDAFTCAARAKALRESFMRSSARRKLQLARASASRDRVHCEALWPKPGRPVARRAAWASLPSRAARKNSSSWWALAAAYCSLTTAMSMRRCPGCIVRFPNKWIHARQGPPNPTLAFLPSRVAFFFCRPPRRLAARLAAPEPSPACASALPFPAWPRRSSS
jgi:hypothetical protein